jgi:hypothetical protein
MITFKKFLSEAEEQDAVKFIQANCSQFVNKAEVNIVRCLKGLDGLERGMDIARFGSNAKKIDLSIESPSIDAVEAYIITPSKNRLPRDTDWKIAKAVDELFFKKFHWRPRSEGVFVFPPNGPASGYGQGDPFSIFPIGDFDFVYSPDVMDLTELFSRIVNDEYKLKDDASWMHSEGLSNADLKGVMKIFEAKYFRYFINTHLPYAIKSGLTPEVILKCDKYLAIRKATNETDF